MLYANTGHAPRQQVQPDPHADGGLADAIWIDLQDGTEAERALVERATDLRVPARTELDEIESSSRLNEEQGVLTLSTPMVARVSGESFHVTPLGFVLTKQRLLTVRFTESKAFDTFTARFADSASRPPVCSTGAFLGVLEAMVDRMADVLEHVGGDLDSISGKVFRSDLQASDTRPNMDRMLRDILRGIGRDGDLISSIRDGLLGLGRIIPFVEEMAASWTPPELRPRFKTLRRDVASLNDYVAQLTNKVQFLLDATLGFISIEQNNGIKVLTVVSVVGVPPTLVASIYGMNFKNIPELNWTFGYGYGLAVIVLSAVLPYLWFKKRGWV